MTSTAAVEEKQKVTSHYRVEVNSFESDEDSDNSEKTAEEITRVVHWPPKEEGGKFVKQFESSNILTSSAVKYSQAISGTMETSSSSFSKEVFKPGKLNMDAKWKPVDRFQTQQIRGSEKNPDGSEQVRRKFKTMDEVIKVDNIPNKHVTYHVPPGTTQTRKAQENYTKHLKD